MFIIGCMKSFSGWLNNLFVGEHSNKCHHSVAILVRLFHKTETGFRHLVAIHYYLLNKIFCIIQTDIGCNCKIGID